MGCRATPLGLSLPWDPQLLPEGPNKACRVGDGGEALPCVPPASALPATSPGGLLALSPTACSAAFPSSSSLSSSGCGVDEGGLPAAPGPTSVPAEPPRGLELPRPPWQSPSKSRVVSSTSASPPDTSAPCRSRSSSSGSPACCDSCDCNSPRCRDRGDPAGLLDGLPVEARALGLGLLSVDGMAWLLPSSRFALLGAVSAPVGSSDSSVPLTRASKSLWRTASDFSCRQGRVRAPGRVVSAWGTWQVRVA